MAHKMAPYHSGVTAALRIDRDAIANDCHPLSAIQLVFKQYGGIWTDIVHRYQIQSCLWGNLFHNLFKTLGIVAKHQRIDGLADLKLRQRAAGFDIT